LEKFIIRRLIGAMITMLLVVTAVFALTRAFGDPRNVYVSDAFNASMGQEQWDALGREFGLDKPMYYQYGLFVRRLLKGELGDSLHQRRPVVEIIAERLPASAKLALGGFIFSILVGMPLGILSAVKRGTIQDYLGRLFAIFGIALPAFWVGILFIFIFGVYLGILPTSGAGGWKSFILPSITLGLAGAASQARLVRSSMLDVLDSEYIKLARAKGVSSTRVIWKHAFRNSMLTPLTYAGLFFGHLITGSVIIETVFAWPGIGSLAIQSVYSSDYATVQGVVMLLLVDLSYGVVDPRIRRT
jgi:peptide/nickel transport system permease protein